VSVNEKWISGTSNNILPKTATLLLLLLLLLLFSRDGSVGIETGYKLQGWGSIPGRGKSFYLLHSVQTGPGAHPASYTMGTMGSFPGAKEAEE
jgi:hypothetical protein